MALSADLWPSDAEVFDRGRKESLVESFGIRGLYGYRSVSLESSSADTFTRVVKNSPIIEVKF